MQESAPPFIGTQSYYLVWFVNDSIQPDHIWVVELHHNGCFFEQFVPALLLFPAKRLDSHLNWSLERADPLSFVDYPKLPTSQLLQKSDAFRLHFKRVFSFLSYLSLYSTEGGNWCPEQAFFQFIIPLGLHNMDDMS